MFLFRTHCSSDSDDRIEPLKMWALATATNKVVQRYHEVQQRDDRRSAAAVNFSLDELRALTDYLGLGNLQQQLAQRDVTINKHVATIQKNCSTIAKLRQEIQSVSETITETKAMCLRFIKYAHNTGITTDQLENLIVDDVNCISLSNTRANTELTNLFAHQLALVGAQPPAVAVRKLICPPCVPGRQTNTTAIVNQPTGRAPATPTPVTAGALVTAVPYLTPPRPNEPATSPVIAGAPARAVPDSAAGDVVTEFEFNFCFTFPSPNQQISIVPLHVDESHGRCISANLLERFSEPCDALKGGFFISANGKTWSNENAIGEPSRIISYFTALIPMLKKTTNSGVATPFVGAEGVECTVQLNLLPGDETVLELAHCATTIPGVDLRTLKVPLKQFVARLVRESEKLLILVKQLDPSVVGDVAFRKFPTRERLVASIVECAVPSIE